MKCIQYGENFELQIIGETNAPYLVSPHFLWRNVSRQVLGWMRRPISFTVGQSTGSFISTPYYFVNQKPESILIFRLSTLQTRCTQLPKSTSIFYSLAFPFEPSPQQSDSCKTNLIPLPRKYQFRSAHAWHISLQIPQDIFSGIVIMFVTLKCQLIDLS